VTLRGTGKNTEALVVHRNLRQDWSLPKGKEEAGEYSAATAVRETAEETGVSVTLGLPLERMKYLSLGLPKVVRFWQGRLQDEAIAAGDIDFSTAWIPNDEIDEVRWVRIGQLKSLLTYRREYDIVMRAADLPRSTSPLVFLRHAAAEKRAAFALRHDGKPPHDNQRPLAPEGEAVTQHVAAALGAYGIQQVVSSPAKRCVDTMSRHFVPVEQIRLEDSFSEVGHMDKRHETERRSVALSLDPVPTAICVHRPVLPTMLRAIAEESKFSVPVAPLKPAEFVVLHRPLKANGKIRKSERVSTDHSAD